MTVTLTPEQKAWIAARVAQGDFATEEDAVRQLLDERIAERAAEARDDLTWAKPYVDQADADVARGKVLTFDEHEARMDTVLASFKD